jgi:AcrR family transcriptional regulator
MEEGAGGTRPARRAETTRALIATARRLAAERGLGGFKIEDVCDDVGVSRRTFFNYFASKDDAVLGIPLDRFDPAAVADFVEKGDDGPGLSPTLLADLATLAAARWGALDIDPRTAADLFRASERDPRLIKRMLELGAEAERFDAMLVEEREGLASGDLRAQLAARLVWGIVHSAADEFLRSAAAEPFLAVFDRHLAAARELFASQHGLSTPAPAEPIPRGRP